MDLTLSPDQLALQDRARRFARDVLQPLEVAFETSGGRLDTDAEKDIKSKAIEARLHGGSFPKEVGGQGWSMLEQVLVHEQLGQVTGGLWGFIPGVLRARLGVNEIITTLMLNYVALFWIEFWVFGPWSKGGFPVTEPFPPEAWLPRLTDFASAFPVLGGLTVHLGLIFGILAATIMWIALERTRWGYELRLIGDSPRAARYAGIDIDRKIIVVFVISGALAGLGGMSEVAGVVHGLQDQISPGYGFTAIIIAYLARFGPFRVIVASILFGALILAGREIQPSGVPAMIQGIVLFSLVGSDVLIRYRIRFDRRMAVA